MKDACGCSLLGHSSGTRLNQYGVCLQASEVGWLILASELSGKATVVYFLLYDGFAGREWVNSDMSTSEPGANIPVSQRSLSEVVWRIAGQPLSGRKSKREESQKLEN